MSPRTPSPEKRAAILDAALDLFVARGFHGTAVPELARAAGVGAGTIYRYFASKEELVNALYQRWKHALTEAVLDDFPFEGSPREQFRAYWQRTMAFARQHPRAQAFLDLHHHADYLDETSRGLEERILTLACALVEGMQARHAVKPGPPEALMAVVYGASLGLIKAAFHGHLQLTDEVIELGETCTWEAIRA